MRWRIEHFRGCVEELGMSIYIQVLYQFMSQANTISSPGDAIVRLQLYVNGMGKTKEVTMYLAKLHLHHRWLNLALLGIVCFSVAACSSAQSSTASTASTASPVQPQRSSCDK